MLAVQRVSERVPEYSRDVFSSEPEKCGIHSFLQQQESTTSRRRCTVQTVLQRKVKLGYRNVHFETES
jgi:hypothetical protein